MTRRGKEREKGGKKRKVRRKREGEGRVGRDSENEEWKGRVRTEKRKR